MRLFLCILTVCVFAISNLVIAQIQMVTPADDEWDKFYLQKALQSLRLSHREYSIAKALYQDSLISDIELERTKSAYFLAVAECKLAVSRISGGGDRTVIESATKRVTDIGSSEVTVSFRIDREKTANSVLDSLYSLMEVVGAGGQDLQYRRVVVSIMDDGVIVGSPYEQVVTSEVNQSTEVTFTLLKETNKISIVIDDGRAVVSKPVFLGVGGERVISIVCLIPSQEVEFGKSAIFRLIVECGAEDASNYELGVDGFPPEIGYYFEHRETRARLTQLTMSASSNRQLLSLVVELPERPTGAVSVDSTLRAEVYLSPHNPRGDRGAQIKYSTEIAVHARGVGKIDIVADSWYIETSPGNHADIMLNVKNIGSKTLRNVFVESAHYHGVKVLVEPNRIEDLPIGSSRSVRLRLLPQEVSEGDYEISTWAMAADGAVSIRTSDRMIRLVIRNDSNPYVFGVVIIVTVALAITLSFGIAKLSRRRG